MLNIFFPSQMSILDNFLKQGKETGLTGLKIITDRQKIKELEPNINDNVLATLFAKETSIIAPYQAATSLYENASSNGVDFYFNNEVMSIICCSGLPGEKSFIINTKSHSNNHKTYRFQSKIIINASGTGAAKIANMVGDNSFKIKAYKGQYILFDTESSNFVKHVNFKLPDSPTSKTKGLLVTPTVNGNFFIGPNYEYANRENISTSYAGLAEVKENASKMFDAIPLKKAITEFAGLRAVSDTNDFIIKESPASKNFINVAGIQSPGLTCAFIIAEMVLDILKNTGIKMKKNQKYIPENIVIRKNHNKDGSKNPKTSLSVSTEESSQYEIVCRCEKITEAEIIDAIKKGATTVDGIKFRTRAGMGRCQGGYCLLKVIHILSRELKIPFDKITKSGKDSYIARYKI